MNRILDLQKSKRAGRIPCITLPNGVRIRIADYITAWRKLKEVHPTFSIADFSPFPMSAEEVLEEFSKGVTDRINCETAWYKRGRKWADEWWWSMKRTARDLNSRCVIRQLPKDIEERFEHRIQKD